MRVYLSPCAAGDSRTRTAVLTCTLSRVSGGCLLCPNSTRRASFLLNELREEQRNGERCELPDIKIGDAIEVTVSP